MEPQNCHVCGQPLDPDSVLYCVCQICGRPFHMALTQGSLVSDCGSVDINPLSLTLRFVCALCAQGTGPQPPDEATLVL